MSDDSGPSVVYGVHLGNTSSCLAISRDGKAEVRNEGVFHLNTGAEHTDKRTDGKRM